MSKLRRQLSTNTASVVETKSLIDIKAKITEKASFLNLGDIIVQFIQVI